MWQKTSAFCRDAFLNIYNLCRMNDLIDWNDGSGIQI